LTRGLRPRGRSFPGQLADNPQFVCWHVACESTLAEVVEKMVASRANKVAEVVAEPDRSPVAAVCRAVETRARGVREELVLCLPGLRARALKLCLDKVEAHDLVQDTVERALRFESSYHMGTNFRAWANQILFSVFVTRCRRRRRERRALDSVFSDPCSWAKTDAPPAMRTLTRRVEQALDALPPQFAAAVRLVDIGELSYKEAAEQLRVPVGTVMSRLFRGRRLLATALGEPAPQPEPLPEPAQAAAA
jgi:RNA polymerase sigma-70 factor, ECF subfamily